MPLFAMFENNSDHPHPAYLQKACPQICHERDLYGIKIPENQGISTEDMAYRPQNMAHELPLLCHMNLLLGWGGLQFAECLADFRLWVVFARFQVFPLVEDENGYILAAEIVGFVRFGLFRLSRLVTKPRIILQQNGPRVRVRDFAGEFQNNGWDNREDLKSSLASLVLHGRGPEGNSKLQEGSSARAALRCKNMCCASCFCTEW